MYLNIRVEDFSWVGGWTFIGVKFSRRLRKVDFR